jgi:hypothetical protein
MRETSYFKQHSDEDGPQPKAKDLGELISIKNQYPQKSAPVPSNQETSAQSSYKQPSKIPTASENDETNKSDRSTKSKQKEGIQMFKISSRS